MSDEQSSAQAPPDPGRRQFLRTAGLLGAGIALGSHARAQGQPQQPPGGPDAKSRKTTGATGSRATGPKAPKGVPSGSDLGSGDIPRRPLGKTGVTVSALAMKMLEESLRRLQTDHLDLWQIHAITYDNDPDLAYAKGGVLEAFDRARQQGKVRFVGFTGHKDPGFHLSMIQRGYPFNTVQIPLNPFDYHFFSFEQQVLPEAARRGIAPLGRKSMGGTADAVKKGVVTAEEMLRYAMSLPVATTISGMESLQVLRQNLSIARGFQPMIAREMQDLAARCAPIAADGHLEMYKCTKKYDAGEGRQQHGYPSQQEMPM